MTVSLARIGTAGWSIAAPCAEEFAHSGSHLQRYAQRLNCVEINSSFYRPHRRVTYERWAGSVPDEFRFSVKLPKAVSHTHGLAGCEQALDDFMAAVMGLGDRLGVLLVQTAPSLALKERLQLDFLQVYAPGSIAA